MTALKSAAMLTLIFILLSCATPYKRAGFGDDGWMGGFISTRIDANTYIISFRGNSSTSYQLAQNYVMYRAAEITINAGYDYFLVTNSSRMPPENNQHSYYQIPCVTCHSNAAVIAIKTFNGSVPIGLANAYDAKEIITHVGPIAY